MYFGSQSVPQPISNHLIGCKTGHYWHPLVIVKDEIYGWMSSSLFLVMVQCLISAKQVPIDCELKIQKLSRLISANLNQHWFIVNGISRNMIQWNFNQNEKDFVQENVFEKYHHQHYCDAIMGTMASQIASLTMFYSTGYSDADQRKH